MLAGHASIRVPELALATYSGAAGIATPAFPTWDATSPAMPPQAPESERRHREPGAMVGRDPDPIAGPAVP
jgi:hypothetical protein